jgi:fatty-acyl-CoA synthase
MNHDLGMIGGVLFPLYKGIPNILATPEFYMRNPKRWFTLLSEAGTDLNFTTNAAMVAACNVLARSKDPSAHDLSELHIFFAAEKLHAKVLDRAYQVFRPFGMTSSQFHVAYGMAENTLGCTVTPQGRIRTMSVVIEGDGRVVESHGNHQHLNGVVSVGAPFPGYDITIRDETGQLVPDRWLGEIWIQGDCVMPGYYRNSDATTPKFDGQMFKTGDLGFMDDGELFFVARLDDLINIGGANISPDDVESVVETLEFLGPGRSCLVAVEEAATGLSKPVLFVEVSARLAEEKAALWRSEIQGMVIRELGFTLGTVRLCAKGTIEKTSSGKKRRKVILERYLQGMIPDIGEQLHDAKSV